MAVTIFTTAALGLLFWFLRAVIKYQRSPLKKYPGPKLAAFTSFYRAYYDIWKDGGFLDHVVELHKQYGPIVRVSPTEIHFSNPDAFNEIHSLGNRIVKDYDFYRLFDMDNSSFSTIDPHASKVRRSILLPQFSQKTMYDLQPMLQDKAEELVTKILEATTRNPIVDMGMAMRSCTIDMITAYLFGAPVGALDHEHFEHPLLVGLDRFVPMTWAIRHFPFLLHVSHYAPEFLLKRSEGMTSIADFRANCGLTLDRVLADPLALNDAEHKTVYTYLLTPAPEKGYDTVLDRQTLVDEAVNLVAAGADTVGTTMHAGVFHILNNPEVQRKLVEELKEAWPEVDGPSPGHDKLTKLPYLTAVIKETLRCSLATPTPLPRVITAEGIRIVGEEVPVGTVVSCGISFVHKSEKVFPEADKFKPERWMQADSKALEHYLISFSRGNRNCLGQHLATFETHLLLSTLFRKLDMKLAGTTLDDMHYRQYAVPVFRRPLVITATKRTD